MSGYPYALGPPGAPPPDPPELPEGADPAPRWPAWYAPAGFFLGITALFMLIAVVAATGLQLDRPGITMAVTVIQYGVFIGVALYLTGMTRRPEPWHFGLRKAPFKRTLKIVAAAIVAYYVIAAIYSAVAPNGKQTVAEDLGANDSTLALVAGAILVIGIAPFAEEFFFRGFFFRALRSRFGLWSAALIDGVVFGFVHYSGSDTLPVLPVLALLGMVFCLVYEWTGTLYAPIVMHAFNNMLAYTTVTHGAAVSLLVGVVAISGYVYAARRSSRRGVQYAH
jgi:membrane protease YdiL (CAAX protease family)